MVTIDERSIVHPSAQIGEGTVIGPFCMIGPNVKMGKNNKLNSHVNIDGYTTIGDNNEFYPFNSIGAWPQDKSYNGEMTETIIGNNNLFRENITVHRATLKENNKTVIGNHCYFMSSVHIAHDCTIGNYVTFASACMCAGHVKVGDYVQMGGQCGVSPFVTVGRATFIGGASAVDRDLPPFCTAYGNRVRLKGINIIGLKRRDVSRDEISEVVEFYRMMESSSLSPRSFVQENLEKSDYKKNIIIKEFSDFVLKSKMGLPSFMS